MKASAYGYQLAFLQKNWPSNTYWRFSYPGYKHELNNAKVKVIGHKPEAYHLWIEDESGQRHEIHPTSLSSRWEDSDHD